MSNALPAPRTRQRPLFLKGEKLGQADSYISNGPPSEPYFPVQLDTAVASLAPQADQIVKYFDSLPNELRGSSLYLEFLVRPNYLAASHHPKSLLNKLGAYQVGTKAGTADYVTLKKVEHDIPTRIILAAVPPEAIKLLPNLIRSADLRKNKELAEEIMKISAMAPLIPENTPPAEKGVVALETVLNPELEGTKRVPASQASIKKFVEHVQSLGGSVISDYIRTVGTLTYVPITIAQEVGSQVARFNLLRALRPMPKLTIEPVFGLRSEQTLFAAQIRAPKTTALSVGVFDGGIGVGNGGTAYFPTDDIELTPEPEKPNYIAHGAAVVGAALYGVVEPGGALPQPPAHVESYRLMPPKSVKGDATHCYWALDQIKAVVNNGTHNIYNLSLGPPVPVNDTATPDRWTSELDTLAWERQALFVVASGNGGDVANAHRVQLPADMVNGLAVGSCDLPEPMAKWSRSPQSSYGPGRHGARIQPLVVQHGGTATDQVHLLTVTGATTRSHGTSFAAPLVTHTLADFGARLGEADPNVLRAAAIHFAQRPSPQRLIREVGHGRLPLNLNAAFVGDANSAQVLYQDRAVRKEYTSYEVPTPTRTDTDLILRVSIAFSSPVDPSEVFDYTMASLDLTLMPHQNRFSYRHPISGQTQTQLAISSEAKQLRSNGWKQAGHPKSQSLTPKEPERRAESWRRREGKWETSRHYQVTLKAGTYEQPQLHLTYLARRNGVLVDDAPPIPFAMFVSVEDKAKRGVLYDQIEAKYASVLVPAADVNTTIGIDAGQ